MKNLELRSSTHDGKLKRQALAAMVYREKQFIHQHWETKGKLLPRESETLHQLSFEFEMHTPLALSRNPNRTFKSLKKKKRKTIKIYQFCCFWGDLHAKQFQKNRLSNRNPQRELHSQFKVPDLGGDNWLPRWHSGKESACQCRRRKRCKFNPWAGKMPWRRKWQPTLACLPGKVQGQRRLVGYSPRGCKGSDMSG